LKALQSNPIPDGLYFLGRKGVKKENQNSGRERIPYSNLSTG
jgi:hypothetical protein